MKPDPCQKVVLSQPATRRESVKERTRRRYVESFQSIFQSQVFLSAMFREPIFLLLQQRRSNILRGD